MNIRMTADLTAFLPLMAAAAESVAAASKALEEEDVD